MLKLTYKKQMQTLVRFLLCCQKSEKDTVEPRQAAHHLKESSRDLSDSSKQGSRLEEREEEEPPAQAVVTMQALETPATLQESVLPLEEQKSQEDGGEDSVKVRKPKKRKKGAKSQSRRVSDPGQVPEGKHQPLPPNAKPRRSILKKRP